MTKQNLRQVYVDTLIELAKTNKNIVSLDTDSREATMVDQFAEIYPDRSFSFGIAEQDMVTAAAGMATMGIVPFVNSYAMFIAMRALDQVRNVVAYPNLNVKMVLSHYGLDTGSDGVTHQLTEDIAIFRSIPNLILLQPADAIEMEQMVKFSVDHEGPVIIKSGKSPSLDVHSDTYQWKYGTPSLIKDGSKVAIISNGIMLERALDGMESLAKEDIFPKLINLSSLTGIDENTLLEMIKDCDHIITLEDHSIYGGIGGIVAEITSKHRPMKISRLGLGDSFAECGSPDKLFAKHGMDGEAVYKAVKLAIEEM